MNFCDTKLARFLRSTSARAETDGAVGLEPMETGENTKECCGLSEWEQPGDNASLHRLTSIVPGMVGGGSFWGAASSLRLASTRPRSANDAKVLVLC